MSMLVACGGTQTPAGGMPQGGDSNSDAGRVIEPDRTCTGCNSHQVCQAGACVDLPSTCPCPKGSYCDLSISACKIGCREDQDCGAGQICDAGSFTCKIGCRSCDDQDPCTADSCQAGSCVHSPAPTGTACAADSNPCTKDICQNGVCAHPNQSDQTACPADANECTDDICKSGVCSHPRKADGTYCGGWSGCVAGNCVQEKSMCLQDNGTWNYQDGSGYQPVTTCGCAENFLITDGFQKDSCSFCDLGKGGIYYCY